jgi:chaperonin GroEL (HSP60 family)
MDLRRGSQAAVEAVLKFLDSNKRTITTKEEIAQVCSLTLDSNFSVIAEMSSFFHHLRSPRSLQMGTFTSGI